jgi:ABC-type dipeptide/oligopeptide/nickel transport system ATPase component
MVWSLFDKRGALKPKIFSNGKSQEDVVNEVVNEINKGTKIIFIRGTCGSGKSAMALNIAKDIGRASIVVPIKNLQRQYQNDYMNDKYVLKKNGEKLSISMITGRNNHPCPYLDDNGETLSKLRIAEKNSSIYDIFLDARKKKQEKNSCDNSIIPCKIEIKTKNIQMLKKYYSENPERKDNSELDLKMTKRFAVAPACPYWSPLLPTEKKTKE